MVEPVQSQGFDGPEVCGRAATPRRGLGSWVCVLVCLAVVLGGCQAKEAPLSKEAQALKKHLLGEIDRLAAVMLGPVAKQDWQAATETLQASYEAMVKEDKLVPRRIGVLDRHGVAQGMFPPAKELQLDFSGYSSTKTVFNEKKKAQTVLYMGEKKVFVVLGPLLQQDQVIGAVVVGFLEEELEKTWKLSEKEFLGIDFNN
jgi:ribosomal protein L37AE/L43A